jgi:hypothetical protein
MHEHGDVLPKACHPNPVLDPVCLNGSMQLLFVPSIFWKQGITDDQCSYIRKVTQGFKKDVLPFPGGEAAKYTDYLRVGESEFLANGLNLIRGYSPKRSVVDSIVDYTDSFRRDTEVDEGVAGRARVRDDVADKIPGGPSR